MLEALWISHVHHQRSVMIYNFRGIFTKTWRQTNYVTGWKTLCEEGCKCICMASCSANVFVWALVGAKSAGQILLEAQIAIVGRQTLQSAYTADLGSPPCLFNWTIILSSVCLLIATLAVSGLSLFFNCVIIPNNFLMTRCQIWCTIELLRDPISKVLLE